MYFANAFCKFSCQLCWFQRSCIQLCGLLWVWLPWICSFTNNHAQKLRLGRYTKVIRILHIAGSVQYSHMHHFGKVDFLKLWNSRIFCMFSWKVYTEKISNIFVKFKKQNVVYVDMSFPGLPRKVLYHTRSSENFGSYFRCHFCWE